METGVKSLWIDLCMKVSISGKSKSRNFDMDILNKLDYALIPTNLIISTGRTIHLITFYII